MQLIVSVEGVEQIIGLDFLLVVFEQPGDEVLLGLALGELGQLPVLQPVGVHQQGDEGHQQAVPHVQNADNLQTLFI